MTKRTSASNQSTINTPTQQHSTLSPQRQQEQAIMLEPFYERLIGMTFNESTTAIERCRDLCAEFGFTVKQEASTHRNIYVYCSREGLPDSLRNPKSNPQRKRPSKRCDCRWRVVLYENENRWEFRKSLNPEAGKHNHELMRPEEIERSWPKDVTAVICELARLRMSTQDIRSRVRGQFPNIHWNERRFYNRLSEERQKIKLRDSVERTHQLTQLWSKVCMATAGNDNLSQFVKQEMIMLFQSICETVKIDPQSFPSPSILKDDDDSKSNVSSPSVSIGHENNHSSNNDSFHMNDGDTDHMYERNVGKRSQSKASSSSKQDSNNNGTVASNSSCGNPAANAPKGYLSVEIPKQIYYIKIHNQRQLHETPLFKNQRRTRTYSEDQSASNLSEPARKISRKGKGRQTSTIISDNQLPSEPIQHSLSPLIPQQYTSNNSNRPTTSSSVTIPPASRQQDMQHHQQQQPTTTFIYYENSNMPLDSSLSGYVHPPFQNNYNMPSTPSTPGFNTPELTYSFDSSMGRSGAESSSNNESNEPTIHPALQSNPMSHQQQQQQQSQQKPPPLNPILQQQPQSRSNSSQQMYSLSPATSNSNANKSSSQQQQQQQEQQQQQIRIIYESPKDNSNDNSDKFRPYQRQSQGLFMTQSSSPSSGNNIIPMYPQQQQQQNPDTSRINTMHQQNPPQ